MSVLKHDPWILIIDRRPPFQHRLGPLDLLERYYSDDGFYPIMWFRDKATVDKHYKEIRHRIKDEEAFLRTNPNLQRIQSLKL